MSDNKSYHRSIGQAPASVSLFNVGQVRRKLFSNSWTKPRRELKFKLGDQVRISKSHRTFKKGYLPYIYTDIIKSQYHGDVVVLVLRTVTVKEEYGSYVSKNFKRPHHVPFNKKIFDTISINIRDEAGDLVAFEHDKVIITSHFRCSKTQYFI